MRAPLAAACWLAVACGSRSPTELTSAPGSTGAAGQGLAILVRNATASALELPAGTGLGDWISVVDERGTLAPIAPYLPPSICERACSEPESASCDQPLPKVTVAAGETLRIPWDGSIRREHARGNWRCFDREPAPPGHYVMRACADQRCATQRFELPRDQSIELVLAARESSAPPPCDAAALARVGRVALGAARLAGVPEPALVGCSELAPTCGGKLDDAPGACRMAVTADAALYAVDFRFAAVDGAPLGYSVWLDVDGVGTGNTTLDATRWAATSDRALAIIGVPASAIHTHGGDPAAIASATFRAYSHAATPQRVTLRSARWLEGGECNVPSNGMPVRDAHLDHELVIAPDASASFSVSFAPQPAYQAWCDRFAVELELDVAGQTLRPVAEIHVSRVEPRP